MKMIKKTWMAILFILASSLTVGAQNSIRYFKKHMLCQQGDAMNVLDFDLEWPEYLNGTTADTLQMRIQHALFQHTAPTWLQAMDAFVAGYGKEVKGSLTTLPEDDKFCYVDCQVREVGMWKNRFASFEVISNSQPQKNSPCKEFHHSTIITYDIQSGECLSRDQILRMSRITGNPNYSQRFSALLLKYVDSPLGGMPSSISMGNNIGIGNNHLVIPYVAYGDDADDYMDAVAYVPLSELDDFLTKEFSKRLAQESSATSLSNAEMKNEHGIPTDVDLLDVVDAPEKKAAFALPGTTFAAYVTQNLQVPELAKMEGVSGKALASFIVESDGTIKDVSIIRPSSPSIDREIVRIFRLMPRWNPAKMNGNSVRSRQFLPLTIKLD